MTVASPRAKAAALETREATGKFDEAQEWLAAMGSLKRLILTASLESPQVTQEHVQKLYSIAEAENPVIWAAFSLSETSPSIYIQISH